MGVVLGQTVSGRSRVDRCGSSVDFRSIGVFPDSWPRRYFQRKGFGPIPVNPDDRASEQRSCRWRRGSRSTNGRENDSTPVVELRRIRLTPASPPRRKRFGLVRHPREVTDNKTGWYVRGSGSLGVVQSGLEYSLDSEEGRGRARDRGIASLKAGPGKSGVAKR